MSVQADTCIILDNNFFEEKYEFPVVAVVVVVMMLLNLQYT